MTTILVKDINILLINETNKEGMISIVGGGTPKKFL